MQGVHPFGVPTAGAMVAQCPQVQETSNFVLEYEMIPIAIATSLGLRARVREYNYPLPRAAWYQFLRELVREKCVDTSSVGKNKE